MEEIKEMLKNIQEDIKQQKAQMIVMQEEITNTINTKVNERLESIEIKQSVLEEKIENQQRKIDNLERHTRKKNLIFFGIPEKIEGENNLIENIVEKINKDLKITCDTDSVETARRLGKKGENTRPVLLTFSKIQTKIQLLKNKKLIEGKSYYFKEDFPQDVLHKRKELQDQLKTARENGKKAIIKYDKLIILEENQNKSTTHKKQENTNNKKRNMSESPENNRVTASTATNKHQMKKNKTDITNFFTARPTINNTININNEENTPSKNLEK